MNIRPNVGPEMESYLASHYSAQTVEDILDVLRARGHNPNPVPTVTAIAEIMSGKIVPDSASQYFFERYRRAQEVDEEEAKEENN